MRWWLGLLVTILALVRAAPAGAQSEPPRVSASIDTRDVAVGDTFTVSLDISASSDGQPVDPRLRLPATMKMGPPSTSQRSEISIVNGRMSRSTGYAITWQVLASREGTFTVGPPSVLWNGQRLEANSFTVVVHPAGSQPRAQGGPFGGRRANPFDPFGMFPHLPGFFDAPTPRMPEIPLATEPELQLEAPLDPNVFLRGIPSSLTAVVGEQITFTIYIYVREALLATGRDPSPKDAHGPTLADFFRRDLDQPDAQPEQKTIEIAGTRWRIFPVDRAALFPLHAGDLPIGSMRLSFPGLSGTRTAIVRESQPVQIHVTEPPLKGRPTGYQVGDVGSFTLAATVEPRNTEVGGAIGVTATIRGTGNLPSKLRIPMQSSVEWLDPQVRDTFEVERGKAGGSKTFTYLVRPKTPGDLDLGTISLPFYNPGKPGYEVARVALGKIVVAPGKTPAPTDTATTDQDPFRAVGPLREKLGKPPADGRPWTDHLLFWVLLFGSPFAVVAYSWAERGARRIAARVRSRGTSPERGIDQALDRARTAFAQHDPQTMLAALDRALHLAIERATSVRARGVLLEELPTKLKQHGLCAELASDAKELLSILEQLRFTPDASERSGDLLGRTDRFVRELGKRSSRQRRTARTGAASAAILALVCLTGARAAAAADAEPPTNFEQAVADMKRGDFDHAIEIFETLADQGAVHPDSSYDRALAYLGRVRAGSEHPGDLGRAAAGFEETLLLRPDDKDAELALESVRAEIARRRARGGGDVEVEARPTIDRALIGLASERAWSVLALLASLVLTIGLVARAVSRSRAATDPATTRNENDEVSRSDRGTGTRDGGGAHAPARAGGGARDVARTGGDGGGLGRVGPARVDSLHVLGMIAVPIGALLLALFAGLAAGAQHLRKTTQDGVVVVHEIRLTDERGTVLPGTPIPEGARVELGEQRGGLVHLRRGTSRGWASLSGVRRLVRP